MYFINFPFANFITRYNSACKKKTLELSFYSTILPNEYHDILLLFLPTFLHFTRSDCIPLLFLTTASLNTRKSIPPIRQSCYNDSNRTKHKLGSF